MGKPVSIPNGDKHDFKLEQPADNHPLIGVSIPNGDKHDFKLIKSDANVQRRLVSIPNGDKHDFKLEAGGFPNIRIRFQSPMGISMISNYLAARGALGGRRFNPQWG